MPSLKRILGSAIAGACFCLVADPAWAGCPSQCNAWAEEPTIEPPLACLQVTAEAHGDCGCDAHFEFTNTCDSALTAQDFTFEYCVSTETSTEVECGETLPAKSRSSQFVELKGDGEWDWQYALDDGGELHTVHIVTHVNDFDDSPGGCQISAAGATSSGGFGALGVSLALLLRRRRAFASCS